MTYFFNHYVNWYSNFTLICRYLFSKKYC